MGIWGKKFKINLKAAMLCLIISVAFWFFKAIGKHYTDSIFLPINISASSTKHIQYQSVPQKIKVNATGSGWHLLSRKLGLGLEPLNIELETLPSCSTVEANLLLNLLKTEYGDLDINYLYGGALKTGYDFIAEKKVKIKLNKKAIHEDSRIVYSNISPNQLTLSGPSHVLDSIPSTVYLELKEIELGISLKEKQVDIRAFLNPNITPSQQQVIISVEFEEKNK